MVSGAGDYLFKGSLSPELLLRSMHYTLERQRLRGEVESAQLIGRRFFDRCPVGGFRGTPDGRLLDCNTAFLEILGCDDREQLLGKVALELYYSERSDDGPVDWLVEGSPLADRRVCLKRVDGDPVWVALRARRVQGRQGSTHSIEGTLVDLTDLERMRQQLRVLQRDLRSLLETTREGVLWLDPGGRILGATGRRSPCWVTRPGSSRAASSPSRPC